MFKFKGVHCVVDGQFGSTGKGVLAAYLADMAIQSGNIRNFEAAIYSGGPNSGHTFYFGEDKHVLKQLPTFAVYAALANRPVPAILSAGAVIDRDILRAEAERYPGLTIFVHPNATILTDEDRRAEESGSIAKVAGTRSGTGSALMRKISRDPIAIADRSLGLIAHNVSLFNRNIAADRRAYFMEVSQGFSLGINSHFYPKVTSRECTVMQGLADARIPPRELALTYMAIRTFPIRVGDVDGHSSGAWYSDQQETTWEHLKVEPEITTVTKRIRRVATFSMHQFYDACYANDPDYVFISHMDYLEQLGREQLLDDLVDARARMNKRFTFILCFGPRVSDVKGVPIAG
jgi:adenylosuccinate synthase